MTRQIQISRTANQIFPGSIPVNFLTQGTIVRAAEIERLKALEGFADCELGVEKALAEIFYCADCLKRLYYIGLRKPSRVLSFAVCPECKRGIGI